MTEKQFIKKHKLTEADVPRLYQMYLSLIVAGKLTESVVLTGIINKLDINYLINY